MGEAEESGWAAVKLLRRMVYFHTGLICLNPSMPLWTRGYGSIFYFLIAEVFLHKMSFLKNVSFHFNYNN